MPPEGVHAKKPTTVLGRDTGAHVCTAAMLPTAGTRRGLVSIGEGMGKDGVVRIHEGGPEQVQPWSAQRQRGRGRTLSGQPSDSGVLAIKRLKSRRLQRDEGTCSVRC